MSVSIYVPLCDSNRPDSFIFTIIILNSIHCKWVKSAWTLNQWLILHSHEYPTNFCTISSECSESVLYSLLYYSTCQCLPLRNVWERNRVNTWSSCFFVFFVCHRFWLQDIEHNIEDFYSWLYKGKCLYHSNKEHCYFSAWVNILQLSEMRRETRLPAKSWIQFGAFLWEVFYYYYLFFNSLSSALRVIKINSDSRAGHSLEWKRQITRGEEKESLCSQVRMRQTPPGSEWPHSVVTVDCSNHMTHQ